jgi:hypothetical protein
MQLIKGGDGDGGGGVVPLLDTVVVQFIPSSTGPFFL